MELPQYVRRCIDALENAGYEAYARVQSAQCDGFIAHQELFHC